LNIAVFYHCKLAGEGIPSEDFAAGVMFAQMNALKTSGLADAASEIHIGVNGDDGQALLAAALAPPKARLHVHGNAARSEIPTQKIIEQWLPTHPDWFVLYHHSKGVTHPNEVSYNNWRGRMEDACIVNWRQCVADLQQGFDAVGCHWLTPEKFPGAVKSPFFGGTFWWATAKYLLQLPRLPEATWQNRFEAESWIGRRRPYPRIRDYFPGWP
jgi:hypothetical protein